jgi:hypothetical protein
MNRTVQSVLCFCFLVPAAAAAAPAPGVDCFNPSRDPSIDYRQYLDACTGGRAKLRAMDATGSGIVVDERTDLATAEAYLAEAPTWTDAQIQAEFVATRDAAYLYSDESPSFYRRLSWLYPDDGCYARAEQVADMAEDAQLPKPFKLFAFGPLNVETPNSLSGRVSWWYHVVPVVKNPRGEAVVLDAAINPCGPLFWKDWLATMVDDITVFDDVQNRNGITVADDAAYHPYSLALDDPDGRGPSPTVNETTSLDALQGGYLLAREWTRQSALNRDPAVWLGSSSPWLSGCTVPCTEATATDLGAQHSITTVSGNSCLKVTNYPGSWVGAVVLQTQGNGSGYPVPLTWSNCSNNGSGTLAGDWSQGSLRPAKNTCTTLIELKGSSSTSLKLTWWANG